MRLVRRRKKSTQAPRRKRSETRQGYVFETTTTFTRRVNWEPLAVFWRAHGGVVLSVLLLTAAAWLGFLFFGTDDFYVYGVAVQGNLTIPVPEILQASGLDGQSIFWVNPKQTAEVVARLPDIKSAEVTACRLPAQVTIRVVERQAQVVWQWQDQQFWVDSYGVVLQPRGTLPEALIIRDGNAAPPRLGSRVDAEAVVAAQQLHDLRPQLRAVTYDPKRGLTLESQEGWPVYLGVGDDMSLKLAILEALKSDLVKQGIRPEYIDLRYPRRPVYR